MAALAQGHTASKWQSWDLNLGLTGPGAVLPVTESWVGCRSCSEKHISLSQAGMHQWDG